MRNQPLAHEPVTINSSSEEKSLSMELGHVEKPGLEPPRDVQATAVYESPKEQLQRLLPGFDLKRLVL